MEYIYRQVDRETEKAFLVQVSYNNRRDGYGIRHQWVAKSICGEIKECEFGRFVQVPTTVIGNGIW